MRTIGNLIWLFFAGIWLAFAYVLAALLNMITIIGIPFGIQAFKLAGYALWPFGRVVVNRPGRDVSLSNLGNVVWFIFGGWFLILMHLVTGVFMMFTIIGIPLGLANIKMAGLALAPFGKQIVPLASLEMAAVTGQISGATIVSSVPMLEDKRQPQLVAGDATTSGSEHDSSNE